MIIYLFIQTIVLSIAAAFIIYGIYQRDFFKFLRRHDLFINIGLAIIYIFVATILAIIACREIGMDMK